MTDHKNLKAPWREAQYGHRAATVWLTGLSGAGKSTLVNELERRLILAGHPCLVLDGDRVREGLNRGLGFGNADRLENMRRVAEVARLANEAGLITLVALISPLDEGRQLARRIIGDERFVEVYMSTPFEVCAARDGKGLYARASAGLVEDFTGVTSTYEVPKAPSLNIDASRDSVTQGVERVHDHLRERFFMSR